MRAAWEVPLASDGQACIECTYQLWVTPASKVREHGVNLKTVCGLKMYGSKSGGPFTVNSILDFSLPTVVPVPGDEYIWAVSVVRNSDGAQGVAAVFDQCLHKHIGETAAPTPVPVIATIDGISTNNSLVLLLNITDYPLVEQQAFADKLATALRTDRARIILDGAREVTDILSLTKARQVVLQRFIISPPLLNDATDSRSAEELSREVQRQQQSLRSRLHELVPFVATDVDAFETRVVIVEERPSEPKPDLVVEAESEEGMKDYIKGLLIGGAVLLFGICVFVSIHMYNRKEVNHVAAKAQNGYRSNNDHTPLRTPQTQMAEFNTPSKPNGDYSKYSSSPSPMDLGRSPGGLAGMGGPSNNGGPGGMPVMQEAEEEEEEEPSYQREAAGLLAQQAPLVDDISDVPPPGYSQFVRAMYVDRPFCSHCSARKRASNQPDHRINIPHPINTHARVLARTRPK